MFQWLQRLLAESFDDGRQQFLERVDSLNAQGGGGAPTRKECILGTLQLRSSTLVLGDPQYVRAVRDVVVPNIDVPEALLKATLWLYPSGARKVVQLQIDLGDTSSIDSRSKIGELPIDSAKVVVADKADIDEHWAEVGKDRIGVISIVRNDELLEDLQRRFKLKARKVNVVSAEVLTPVSESLEKEIEAYLKSIPRYAKYPFLYFRVQTNNSFDRVNYMNQEWGFMPVGNQDLPLMFACGTGHGDGSYDVMCGYSGNTPRQISICFIEESDQHAS